MVDEKRRGVRVLTHRIHAHTLLQRQPENLSPTGIEISRPRKSDDRQTQTVIIYRITDIWTVPVEFSLSTLQSCGCTLAKTGCLWLCYLQSWRNHSQLLVVWETCPTMTNGYFQKTNMKSCRVKGKRQNSRSTFDHFVVLREEFLILPRPKVFMNGIIDMIMFTPWAKCYSVPDRSGPHKSQFHVILLSYLRAWTVKIVHNSSATSLHMQAPGCCWPRTSCCVLQANNDGAEDLFTSEWLWFHNLKRNMCSLATSWFLAVPVMWRSPRWLHSMTWLKYSQNQNTNKIIARAK